MNVHLFLHLQWRSRQARIKALNSTDKDERRQLLAESEENLRRCLSMDSSDPRTYVVLGKLLMMQKRYQEARALYSEGVANTGEDTNYAHSTMFSEV